LGMAIGNLANVLNLDMVVLGGSVVTQSQVMFEAACRCMKDIMLSKVNESLQIRKARLDLSAGLVGAAALSLSHVLKAINIQDVYG